MRMRKLPGEGEGEGEGGSDQTPTGHGTAAGCRVRVQRWRQTRRKAVTKAAPPAGPTTGVIVCSDVCV